MISLVITVLTIATTYRIWKQLRDLKSRMRAHESFEESQADQEAGEEEEKWGKKEKGRRK